MPRFELCAIGIDLEQSLYALDSTTIDLCLSLFPWARFRKHKGAAKMHALLDLHGSLDNWHARKVPFSASSRNLRDGDSSLRRFAFKSGRVTDNLNACAQLEFSQPNGV